MENEFINNFLQSIESRFSPEDLAEIKLKLILSLQNYEIAKKSTSIVPAKRKYPEAFFAFLVAKKVEGMSINTLSSYKNYLEHMFDYIDKDFTDITANDIRIYLYNVQKDRELSNRSLDSRRTCLSSFWGWSNSEGYVFSNPMLTIKPIKYEVKEVQPLTDYQLEKIRLACSTPRERAIVETLYSTGCRVTELTRLNISDINLDKNSDTAEVVLFGKGNKHRKAYLSSKAIINLQEYLAQKKVGEDKDALFTSQIYPYQRIKKHNIEKIVKNIGKRAGLDNLHPHQFRHTLATNCLQRGMELTQVSKLLGHSNVDTTTIYAKTSDEDIKTSHKKFIN